MGVLLRWLAFSGIVRQMYYFGAELGSRQNGAVLF